MKKFIGISLFCVLLLSSCGSNSGSATSSTAASSESSVAVSSKEVSSVIEGIEANEEGDIGDVHIKISNATFAVDENGNDAISITYDFTNNSSETAQFATFVQPLVYQNEQGISQVIVDKNATVQAAQPVKPGETAQITLSYKLLDKTAPVKVLCKGGSSNKKTEESVSRTFTLPLSE